MFFALLNASGAFASDVTQVAWGTLQLTNGGDASVIYYDDFVAGTGTFQATSASLGTTNCGSYAQALGYFSAVRCKIDAAIFSIGPLVSTIPRVVGAGGTITITGADFSSKCINCNVVGPPLAPRLRRPYKSIRGPIFDHRRAAFDLNRLPDHHRERGNGQRFFGHYGCHADPSTIAASPAGLQFSYVAGGTAPAAQSIQITNSGSGTLAWTATASDSWLGVSPASGTAPLTLSITVSPASLSAGTYTGSVQITSSGASNTPLSIPVTLTVTQPAPALSVAPQTLSFTYSVGGATPAAQTVSITNAGGGALAWAASASDYWLVLSPSSGNAPGTLSISINPANLAAGTYTSGVQIAAAGATGSPASIAIMLTVQGTQPPPSITAVANAGGFQTSLASATWVSIFGTNLSTVIYTWQNSDFVNGMLPTTLEGVSVTINGMPAFIDYISPTQINVLAPDDAATGPVQVQVTVAQQTSNSFSIAKNQFAPAFFTIDNGGTWPHRIRTTPWWAVRTCCPE